MFLYNITLQRATGITHAIHGNFSGEAAPKTGTEPEYMFKNASGSPSLSCGSLNTALCVCRDQDAGDCCFQRKDLGITATRR